ncbi:MAG: NDP-sugar synthase [bacterium]
MKALILCAGYGTRLKPLTDSVAKPLVNVLGIPILEYTLNFLDQNGIKEVFVNRHYFPEQFENIRKPKEMNISFSLETEILGTLGGVLSFEQSLKDDDFLVINGDIIFDINLEDMISRHKRKKNMVTMALRKRDNKETAIFVDDFSNVVAIGGEPSNIYKQYMFSGIQILNPGIFSLIKSKKAPKCLVRDFYIPYLSSGGHINSFIMNEKDLWIETGDMKKYLDCNIRILELLSKCELSLTHEEFVTQYCKNDDIGSEINEIVDNIWIGNGSYIDSESTLCAPVFIGTDVKIEKGSVVGPNTIIGNNVTVSENTHISDSLVLEGVYIEKNKKLNRNIISSDLIYEDK